MMFRDQIKSGQAIIIIITPGDLAIIGVVVVVAWWHHGIVVTISISKQASLITRR
jgi:hypothetical protein